jgi:predicted nucleic acid-binding protein
LPLLRLLDLGTFYLPNAVEQESLAPSPHAPPQPVLQAFVRTCQVLPVEAPREFATALSLADRCVLELALRCQADLVVADDSALRRAALALGLRPLGTLGILALAAKRRQVTSAAAIGKLHELVTEHGFRVSAAVYAEFERRLNSPVP